MYQARLRPQNKQAKGQGSPRAPPVAQPRDVISLKLIPGSARSQRHAGCLIKRAMKKMEKCTLMILVHGEKLAGVLSKSSRKRKFSSGQSRKRKKSSQPRIEGDNHDIVYHDIFLQQILSLLFRVIENT